MRGKGLLLVVGGVVAVIAVIAALGTDSESTEIAYGDVQVSGSILAPHDPAAADPAVGQEAPRITGETATVDFGDQPTVVLFLAHWCSFCQREVPRLTEWVTDNGMPEGVSVVAVATASSPTQGNFPPSRWLEREEFPFPVVYDDEAGTAAAAYGVTGFPFWAIIDSDGRVVERFSGELPNADAVGELFAAVADL